MKFNIVSTQTHPSGKTYEVTTGEQTVSVVFTVHALERTTRWRLTEQTVLRAVLFPEEVVRGHRDRFIAHRRTRGHVVRVVYEYEGVTPIIITVYYPFADRYFQGGGTYEDRILA